MSYTKALRRKIQNGMTLTDMQCLKNALSVQLETEKNLAIKSSLRERVALLDRAIMADLAKSLNS